MGHFSVPVFISAKQPEISERRERKQVEEVFLPKRKREAKEDPACRHPKTKRWSAQALLQQLAKSEERL